MTHQGSEVDVMYVEEIIKEFQLFLLEIKLKRYLLHELNFQQRLK